MLLNLMMMIIVMHFIYWAFAAIVLAINIKKIPYLVKKTHFDCADTNSLPLISVIIAAKNEEKEIAHSVQSILAQDYPNFELIIVNDRSTDHTAEQIKKAITAHQKNSLVREIKTLHITDLPKGWLGKNHALYQGYLRANGKYLLFTDGDIHFEPFTLSSTIATVTQQKLDHLTMAPFMRSERLFLRSFVHLFLFSLTFFKRMWLANNHASRKHGVGIGAFNLVSKNIYEKAGTHQALAMRPDDDLMLGVIIKKNGGRCQLAVGHSFIGVEWYVSIREAVKGLEKNLFAGMNYSVVMSLMSVIGIPTYYTLTFIMPLCAWLWGTPLLFVLSILNIFLLYFAYWVTMRRMSPYPTYDFVFLPVTALILSFIFFRTTFLTLKQGGVYWRGTFYSLKELKSFKISDEK